MRTILLLVLIFSGCSDKYKSFEQMDRPPVLTTSKEELSIREKDELNIYRDAGVLVVDAFDYENNLAHYEIVDSSKRLKVFYDSTMVTGAKLPAVVPLHLFVACDYPGNYKLYLSAVDRFGKRDTKVVPVSVLSSPAPTASMKATARKITTDQFEYLLDAGSSSSPYGRIREFFFEIDGIDVYSIVPQIGYVFYEKGLHKIQLYVKDDLGQASQPMTVNLQID